MMLWGGVGMFLSLLQFFATKFLLLALDLESGSFLLSLRMSKKLSSILMPNVLPKRRGRVMIVAFVPVLLSSSPISLDLSI